jgi:hypothetical protein
LGSAESTFVTEPYSIEKLALGSGFGGVAGAFGPPAAAAGFSAAAFSAAIASPADTAQKTTAVINMSALLISSASFIYLR